MKKIISVFCAIVLVLTTVIIAVPTVAAEVVAPEGQDRTLASTIVCSSKPTTIMNYATNAQRRSIASISKLTANDSMRALGFKTYNGFDTTMNNTHNVAAFDFPAGAVTDENGGYMLYLDLPVFNSYADKDVPIPHDIAIQRHSATGTVLSYTQKLGGKNDTISWYILPEGEENWIACNEWVVKAGSPYALRIGDGTKPFRGYVYIPTKLLQKNGYVDTSGKEIGAISFTVDVDRKTYGGSGDGRGSERGVAPIDVSAVTLISSFNADTTCVYNDKGEIVDLAAEEEDKNIAELPYWEDENGNSVDLYATAEKIPSNITTNNITLTENTSKLPLTSLFSYTVPEDKEKDNVHITLSETVSPDAVKGAVFYVEIPEFKEISYTFDKGTPETSDDSTRTTDKFRLAITFSGYDYVRNAESGLYSYNTDGSIKTVNKTYLAYGSTDWYIRGVNDNEWKQSADRTYYGIGLPSGFKGYVCVPFNALNQTNYTVSTDSFITGVNIIQLTNSKSVVFREEHNKDVAEYGYIPEGKSLVISQPVWMSGNYMDGADDFTASDEITINGVDYNYKTGKVIDYSSTPENLNITKIAATPTANMDYENAYGSKTALPSTSLVTNEPASKVMGYRAYGDSYDTFNSMISQSVLENPIEWSSIPSAGGFLFHVSMPALDDAHTITVTIVGLASDGATVNSRSVNVATSGTSVMYLLKDGTTSWESRTEGVEEDWVDTYQVKISDGSEPWSGYIFVPKNAVNNWGSGSDGVATVQKIGVTFRPYRSTNKTPNTQDVHGTVSAPVVVSNFTATSTLSYASDGSVVDLVSGKKLDFDYNSPAEFVGKTELINNGNANVLTLNNLAMKETPVPSATPAIIDAGSLKTGAKYVESICPVTKVPSIAFSGTLNASRSQAIQYTFQDASGTLYGGDIDGFMFYIKNGPKAIGLGFGAATYITSDEGASYTVNYSSAYGYASTLPLLAKGATSWTATTAATPVNGVSLIPANFEGYVYVPKFGNMTDDLTKIWRLNFYMAMADDGDENTTDDFNAEFTLGALMTVKKGTWSKNYAGMAFANGSKVAQNMFDGSFTVPNDTDGDMRVSLLDLVKAKETQSASQFATFRNSYLDSYYEEYSEKEYTSVNYEKTLTPLYAEGYAALSDNPDRGYRTEMVISIQEALDEGETSDARSLFTTDSEAKIRETMNQIFEIYFPTKAEHHSKLAIAFISFKDWNKSEYLPQEVLDILEIYFEYLRKYEVRVLLRFAYGVPTNLYIANAADREKLEKVCADEATMIRHIKQLSPFVAKHRDVVHKISSGWIGNGEMVASFQWPAVNFDNVIKAVVEELCVPNNLYFTVRLPRYKVDMLNNYKVANGTDYPYADIIGFNNDAVYGEQTHTGHNSGCFQYNHEACGTGCFLTKSNYFDEWQYAIKTAAYTPQCGEMFTNQSLFEENKVPTGFEVMLEMAHHRYTGFSQWHGYLDTSGYREDSSNVFSSWINNENYSAADIENFGIIYDPNSFVEADGTEVTLNPYEYLRDHLGYKLVASDTTLNWSGNHNDSAAVSLSFKNYGFAAPFTLESGFAILDEDYNLVYKVREGNADKWYSLDPDFYTEEYVQEGTVIDNVLDYELNAKLSVPKESGKYYVAFYLQNGIGEGARLSNDIAFEKEFNILHEIIVE